MEIDIFEEKENKLFNRKEIKFYVDYDGEATPKVLDVKSKLVALLNTKKDLIVVDNVQPHYGEPKALGYAKVYDTVEDLEYIETKHVIAKNTEVVEETEDEEE
ncbi:30S ribosomal protein S24e [Methanobrevibacter millerae]|uniref:Small ribosomal subunit protein eS24 n=1 Tax=Methanobrevibacter millerae TaxID=230361 RepID=A0A1G5V482_9EURY|nr:30S ribosomal protein S24e [Methanobrevibacter millerae]SDA40669.1 small subunit ribosomal protein S24e [Methanobrevibacter millerae]